MYPHTRFQVTDPVELRAFVDTHPFATLVAVGDDGSHAATHLPLLVHHWDESVVLRGHVMLDTDHGRALLRPGPVFACFMGPDAPVLGSWQLTSRFGGTWNYQAVHVHGFVQRRDDATLMAHLEALKDRFEDSPAYRYASLPPDYVPALMPMIACIDIVAERLHGIFKLSQNRRIEEFDRTAAALQARGGKAALVADAMLARRAAYYPDQT
jgi:transcriptional regulator